MYQIIADRFDPLTGNAVDGQGWQYRFVAVVKHSSSRIASVQMRASNGQITVFMIGAGNSEPLNDRNRVRLWKDFSIAESLLFTDGKLKHIKYTDNPSFLNKLTARIGGWRVADMPRQLAITVGPESTRSEGVTAPQRG